MGSNSPERNPGINLKRESLRLKTWDNDRGIYWQFENTDDGFQRIECGLNENGEQVLRVAMKVKTNWPVFREPTVDEVFRFVQITKHIMPESEHTKMLRLMARDHLNKEESQHKEEAIRIRELRKQI